MRNLFRLASLASMEGFFYKPRIDREMLARYAAGLIAHHRLPGRRGADPAADRATTSGPCAAAAEFRDIFGAGQLLPRADGPRAGDRAAAASRPAAAAPTTWGCRCWPPTTCTTRTRRRRRARGAAVRAVRQDHGRPEAVQVRRRRLLPQVAGGDAPGLARAARGLRQHAGDRRAGDRLRRHPRLPGPDAALRRPGGDDRGQLPDQGGRARAGPPVPCRRAGRPTASRRNTSWASSSRWASRATSWSSATSAGTRARPASGSAPAAARPPARWWRTRWASPSSTRSSTGCCSSASSTPSASRCPTSTWTSTSAGAAT